MESTGEFLPGHDQKLRANLERRVGGLLPLRALVGAAEAHQAGLLTDGDLGRVVRGLLAGVVSKATQPGT
jgi:hypothetical protein